MVQAIWNGALLAESNATIIVEGNHYFPPPRRSTGNTLPRTIPIRSATGRASPVTTIWLSMAR